MNRSKAAITLLFAGIAATVVAWLVALTWVLLQAF